MELSPDVAYNTRSFKLDTPDGMMFVHIVEDEERFPIQVLVNIGKSGSNLAAWAEAVARLASQLLPHAGVQGVVEEISGITSEGLRRLQNGEVIRSGPEGISVALLKYIAEWHREHRPKPRDGGPSIGTRG